ncbi:succinate dehydrogenase, hydrophobic membrane anchor protein [Alkalimonas mucilaginosa]|uniref:Succinate dehydrogenase hydrophobic membrane anchor subunit n=1 Tax=Alkalimonas mucilaginosa TaxID=3057676 RepID=A0ABU7JL14_9GAMM|nr:succinate dehydrogenase, hydrophobic membrane anchor protein [Alkalimonas sp. MEB004]MEE2025673.1 succinate dehydrogenase, hydrophobic membrane anchor protein [Alkalimonas sp. MEB004]
MVLNQASLKRDGVQDYVSIRATATVLGLYVLFILGFFLVTPEVTYEVWNNLFAQLWMKVFTLLALISVAIHARIGLWQVVTDYIKNAQLRALVQFIVSVMAFSYVAVGLFVLWGLKVVGAE